MNKTYQIIIKSYDSTIKEYTIDTDDISEVEDLIEDNFVNTPNIKCECTI